MRTLVIIVVSLLLFTIATPVSAQIWNGRYTVICNQSGEGPCDFCDAIKVTANIVDFLVEITLVLAVLMIVYGALMMMISGGNEQRYTGGKSAITNAVIGIAIALGSWLIVNTIIHVLSGNPNIPWAEIAC